VADDDEVEAEDWKARMAEGATSAASRIADNMDCIVVKSRCRWDVHVFE
jgi:hypothetical protein